ncbi:hypothetical protein AVEN_224248-1 [Araneus ventricosus]|uniref:Uncharacterized protein n=1 Tax=Araneus ventricosus TaxID=182803 RepID=A0A4Y2NDT9_ARAVE|nr:hypothetical protein AVEN_224248-1 [Araneus ventricosus]
MLNNEASLDLKKKEVKGSVRAVTVESKEICEKVFSNDRSALRLTFWKLDILLPAFRKEAKSAAVVGGKGCVGGSPSGSREAIAGVLQELVPVKSSYCC